MRAKGSHANLVALTGLLAAVQEVMHTTDAIIEGIQEAVEESVAARVVVSELIAAIQNYETQPTLPPVQTPNDENEPPHLHDQSAYTHEEVVAAKELNIEPAEIIVLKCINLPKPVLIQDLERTASILEKEPLPEFDPTMSRIFDRLTRTSVLVEELGVTTPSEPDELLAAATTTPLPQPSTLTNDDRESNKHAVTNILALGLKPHILTLISCLQELPLSMAVLPL
ncbi:hypothetical protein BDR07DRAFT_1502871 [Suillus spraguei]|nr:hypothetical protein BDR07DRAFT_1502871 [Suillus spraguei]